MRKSLKVFDCSCTGCKEARAHAESKADAAGTSHVPVPAVLIQEDIAMKKSALFAVVASVALLAGCQTAPPQVAVAPAPVAVAAPAPAATMISPMVEKRETFAATGYAVISVQHHNTAAQQRLLAIRASKLDAYRSLTEQVYGQQLDATTTVADMTVLNDTFRTRVEGIIYGAQLVSITPVGDDTYETTLSLDRAVVQDLRSLYLNQLASRQR